MPDDDAKISVLRFQAGQCCVRADDLAAEEPLEIRVRGRAVSVTMRTPGQDDELAAGFLLTEGIIRRPGDLLRIEPCQRSDQQNVANAILRPDLHVDFDQLTRHVFASSSCGLCGKATIDAIHSSFSAVNSDDLTIDPSVLLELPGKMQQAQESFQLTGGLHAAAIFNSAGELLVVREDVGRHNAVDKVLGFALLRGLLPLSQHVLLVSGRASFEIVQKALAGGVPVVAAVSAPSNLAVEFAKESRQTLVGFLREQRMNVYSHPNRIRFTTRT